MFCVVSQKNSSKFFNNAVHWSRPTKIFFLYFPISLHLTFKICYYYLFQFWKFWVVCSDFFSNKTCLNSRKKNNNVILSKIAHSKVIKNGKLSMYTRNFSFTFSPIWQKQIEQETKCLLFMILSGSLIPIWTPDWRIKKKGKKSHRKI